MQVVKQFNLIIALNLTNDKLKKKPNKNQQTSQIMSSAGNMYVDVL
jgi:hypothetical protein